MRKFQIAAVLAFGMVLFGGAQLARAQSLDAVTTTVPFPFMVENVLLPPGYLRGRPGRHGSWRPRDQE